MNTITVKKSRLQGIVEVSGAKNSALRLLAASLLTEELVELYNSPNGLLDMDIHIRMLVNLEKTFIHRLHKLPQIK